MMIAILPTVVLALSMKAASTSIAGITYIDDYGVGSRYRNVHECDPFYWHPLHLPEYCAQMYERLIRSRLGGPVHIPEHRERPYVPVFETDSVEYEDKVYTDYRRPKTKQDSLMESLNRDIQYQPSQPEVRMSNIGPIAVYRQPVSKRSEGFIKGMAGEQVRPSKRKLSSRKRRKEKRKKSKLSKKLSKMLRARSSRHENKYSPKLREVKDIGRLLDTT